MKTTNKKVEKENVTKSTREWYEFVTPLLGIKWGAVVTLIGYTWINNPNSHGLKVACIILSVFTVIEWAQMSWREFKYRGQK